ncbi:centromere protein F [Spea bombifrons]|uniref:centromere protein F n=1 Tax=Spea bombifrons TaxID=233779 RepID=UPI002348F787|nr:centromere protein F [Spea bombifrons]
MSWVVEEWKEGLPTKTLQKIQELESQLDKLKKERQQRQFQFESLEAAFQKQKQKVESEKSEVTALKRENQSLIELCDTQEKTKQKLIHDHQVKESQANFLEGQLTSSKKHIEKLEQELKRYKNDLEKSQHSFNAGDMSLCVTPQKASAVVCTPNNSRDSKYDELLDKYNKEVEERKRLEAELKLIQLKTANPPPQPSSQGTMNHRDIARHQSSSSVFSWQQDRTPSRSSHGSHETPLKRSFASTHFPWEQEETPIKKGYKPDNSLNAPDSCNVQAHEQLRIQNQELKSKISEMDIKLQVQEKELKNQVNRFQEIQILLEKTQTELSEKDKALTKSRDDLARGKMQLEQSNDKCVLIEQKLKKVSEELSCQRQNAESARITLEQKLKEREKENQQELLRLQNSLQNMEQQLNQTKARLSQESQQAKNEFNAVQSELDKMNHAKRILEIETEELKQKLSRSEQALNACQKNEHDFKKLIEEAKREQNALKSQYDQKSKEALKLEEELKTVNQTLRQNQLFAEEQKNKTTALEAELKSALEKMQDQDSASFEGLKMTVSNLEKERDFCSEVLKKRELDAEQSKITLARMEEQSAALKHQVNSKEKECKELIVANISLCGLKNEQEKAIGELSKEREDLAQKIGGFENVIQTHLGQIHLLENDKNNLNTQIKTLQDIVEAKGAELEIQKAACRGLESESQTFRNEMERLLRQISDLKGHVAELSSSSSLDRASCLEKALDEEKQANAELQRQHDELLENHTALKNRLAEYEAAHQQLVAESKSLENKVASEERYIESVVAAIKVKDEEIDSLSEKLRLQEKDLQAAHQTNQKLDDKLQEINLNSESWSAEREALGNLISSNQREIERLADENKRIYELYDKALNSQKTEASKTNDLIHVADEKEEARHILVDGRSEGSKELEDLKLELAELKKVHQDVQKANGELRKLVCDLRSQELSQSRALEEFKASPGCEERDPVEFEAPEMDVDEKQKLLRSLAESSVDLDDVSILAGCDNERSCTQEHPEGGGRRLETASHSICRNSLSEEHAPVLSDIPADVYDSVDASEAGAILEANHFGGRRSISDRFPSKKLNTESKDTDVLEQSLDAGNLIQLLALYQTEVDDLKKQHISEMAVLHQKMKAKAAEMETKLAEEKKQTEQLSLELEAARLELQCLDLSARSILSFDVDDLTRTFDATNQSLCSVLPIGSLSLNNTLSQIVHDPKDPIQSPCSKNTGETKQGANLVVLSQDKSPGQEELTSEITEDVKRSPKSAEDYNSVSNPDTPSDRLKSHIENLRVQAQQFSNENLKLLELVKEGEAKIETLVAEITNLNVKIEMQKSEFSGKETSTSELQSKVKELEDGRVLLFEKLESHSSEKQQLTARVGDLEKDLSSLSNTAEMLKIQLSDLSAIREGLEISNGELREKYLQTENELKRTRSEKSNIESHALSMEADLDALQAKCQHLQDENAENLKSVTTLQERITQVLEEKMLMNQELESLTEEKAELEKTCERMKAKENELEMNKTNTRELIKILEAEIRALKSELHDAKSVTEQMSRERESLIGLQEIENSRSSQLEDLQNQIQQMQEERSVLLQQSEEIRAELSAARTEKNELSGTLERCQSEKHEMATSLRSAQEEVSLMRAGIEKLKIKIESDDKKKRHVFDKLKEAERSVDGLKDKIESLERELAMSEENLEGVILQTETIKEEAENLKSQKEVLENEMNTFRRKATDLENKLMVKQETIVTLEATIRSLTGALENNEMAQKTFKEESEKEQLSLQMQLSELREQKKLSEEKFEEDRTKHVNRISLLEQNETQLSSRLEEAQIKYRDLERSVEKLTADLDICKTKLEDKTERLLILEDGLKGAERLENKYSAELSRSEVERENLRNEKETLRAAVDKLEAMLQNVSAANRSHEATIADLRKSCEDLQIKAESSAAENTALLQKADKLSENCDELQQKLREAEQRIETLQQASALERKALEEQTQTVRQQNEENNTLLLSMTSQRKEMEETIANLRLQAQNMKGDIEGYESRLLQADAEQHALLEEIKQHKGEIQSYRGKLARVEADLNNHKLEIHRLKAGNDKLKQSAVQSQQQLLEFNQLKAEVARLEEENAGTCRKLDRWVKSCEELEREKEQLENQIKQREEAENRLHGVPNADGETSLSVLMAELEELKQSLEEKSLEADENVEKYCTLIIETHKLEEANDSLRKEVDLLSSRLKELETLKESPPLPPTSESPSKTCKGRRSKDRRSVPGTRTSKRQRTQECTEDVGEQTYTTPTSQRVTKRVKKTGLASTPQTTEDVYLEPEGLPEAVKKGFSDIPSGKQSPYVLRRTELPRRRSPRLSAQKRSPSSLLADSDDLENLGNVPNRTDGGSRSQKVNKIELFQLEAAVGSMELSSPLSTHNRLKGPVAQSPRVGHAERDRGTADVGTLHERSESEETCNVQ